MREREEERKDERWGRKGWIKRGERGGLREIWRERGRGRERERIEQYEFSSVLGNILYCVAFL